MLSWSTLAAHLSHLYPGLYYNEGWPTRDNFMPWKLALVFGAEVEHTVALDRLTLAEASMHATTVTTMENDAKARRLIDDLVNRAYPTIKVEPD